MNKVKTFTLSLLTISCQADETAKCEISYSISCTSQLSETEMIIIYPKQVIDPWNEDEDKCNQSSYTLPLDTPESFHCNSKKQLQNSTQSESAVVCDFEGVRLEYDFDRKALFETDLQTEEQKLTVCESQVLAQGSTN